VQTAGRPPGWLEAAERTVAELGWNVARTGAVFVVAADRDIEDLVRRTPDAALAVRDAILAPGGVTRARRHPRGGIRAAASARTAPTRRARGGRWPVPAIGCRWPQRAKSRGRGGRSFGA